MSISAADLDEIQGDIIHGFLKHSEDFYFFNITDVSGFKDGLKVLTPRLAFHPDVQTVRAEISARKRAGHNELQRVTLVNIAFSAQGLRKLGFSSDLGDQSFQDGQFAHAQDLNDKMKTDSGGNLVPDWFPEFSGEPQIDGVILSGGDSRSSVDAGIAAAHSAFRSTIQEVLRVHGNVRPDDQKGHEHFGFKDGISSPAIKGVTDPIFHGQQVVRPGILICGQDGDPVSSRPQPALTKNGSFLVYRHLTQLVPEFNKFVDESAPTIPTVPPGPNAGMPSELFAARLMGRWKSGAPVELAPVRDDPILGNDPTRNNHFDYKYARDPDQSKCPFVSHVRKAAPRTFLTNTGREDAVALHQIMRQGIPFGPELTPEEVSSGVTRETRGLAFACYQSSIVDGFEFIQQFWSNNVDFPDNITRNGKPVLIGHDPIIGQAPNGGTREAHGVSEGPANENTPLALPVQFVVSKGGAYFFSPSKTALGMLSSEVHTEL